MALVEIPNIEVESNKDTNTLPRPDSWKYVLACKVARRMDELGLLPSKFRQKTRKEWDVAMREWADVIRLAHEQDGIPREHLEEMFLHHLQDDSFYVINRAFLSIYDGMRRKRKDGAPPKLDNMYQGYLRDTMKTPKSMGAKPGDVISEERYLRIIKARPNLKERFLTTTYDANGNPRYRFME